MIVLDPRIDVKGNPAATGSPATVVRPEADHALPEYVDSVLYGWTLPRVSRRWRRPRERVGGHPLRRFEAIRRSAERGDAS